MLPENGIVRVGTEIEVAAWQNDRDYKSVMKTLLKQGYMDGTPTRWPKYHDYNCRCDAGCAKVASGAVLLPHPLVSVQYDASLPADGAEFIVSPVLLIDGMAEMRPIWEIVTEHAHWRTDLTTMRGRPNATPSIHLHVSSLTPGEIVEERVPRGDPPTLAVQDMLHSLSLFAAELLLLSDHEEFRRGLKFRQPWRLADGRNGHHGFVHIRRVQPNQMVHIEWRLFEAAYGDWNYFETTAYLAGALTRALVKPRTVARLMQTGYEELVDPTMMEAAIARDDTEAALALASRRRLDLLWDLIEEEMTDDPYGLGLLATRFEEVRARV